MIAWPKARLDIQVFAALLRSTTGDGLALHRLRSQSAAMTRRLPHGDQAILDMRKIEDYCLNPRIREAGHKARVFREALDLQRSDASWLSDALLEAARSGEACLDGKDAWGTHWHLDANVRRQGKSAVVRMIWIVRTGESVPRFVTCWVL
jgi:hypothetical protein